ncbi:MCE family protein [Mycobacterium numidiamassiliense]|nr:MCE family protein [Mycobacterium numidiamassiliense]
MLAATGCAFNGLNSLPLPGTVGRGPNAHTYHVDIANVGTLESNSPVMINDVVVGSISKMAVHNWHAYVDVSLKPAVVVPANVVATVGQTSLLGSMHLELSVPPGQTASGRLPAGATIPLSKSSAFPSTEQTLSSLSVMINSGGFTQIGDIIHNFNASLSGHAGEVRDLLERLDRFVNTIDLQRDNLVRSVQALNRLAGTLAGQRDVITEALNKIPPALDVLLSERPRIVTALDKLRTFSDTATKLVNDAGDDLVKNLKNLEPTIGALADVGPEIDDALAYAPTYPLTQNVINRAVRGDFLNGFFTFDLTNARLRKGLLLGTHWGRLGADLVPAPGDPAYLQYQYPEGGTGVAPPVGQGLAPVPNQGLPLPAPPPSSAPGGDQGPPAYAPGPPPAPAPQPAVAPGLDASSPIPGATPVISQPPEAGP